METTQQEDLKRYIWIIQDWTARSLPDHILTVFNGLEDMDTESDKNLWDELNQAILNNKEFEWEPFQKYIEPFMGDEFWWKSIRSHRK